MKGLIRGAAGLAVVLAMSACSKDETIDLMGAPTGVQATPVSAFTSKGDSVAILLRLVNDRNQAIPAEFTIANVGPSLSVAYDNNYRPDYTGGDTLIAPAVKPQQRYFAKGALNGTSTFTASSGGFTTTVTVTVLPKTLENALSKTTGVNYGDTLTITAPQGTLFTPTSAVSFAAGTSSIASRAADSTSIKVVVGPGTGGVATITNVYLPYAPTLAPRTVATGNSLTATPGLSITMAPLTGLVAGSTLTITAAPGSVFWRTPGSTQSVVSFLTGTASAPTFSADSTSLTVVLGPGVSGPATVTRVGIPKAPGVGVFTVKSTTEVPLIPAITVAPTTVSNAAPNIGQSINVTLGGSLRFTNASQVLIGGKKAGIVSVSADSSTAVVMPMFGSTGVVSYTGIALSFLNSIPLSVPGDKNVTVTNVFAGPSDPNSNAIATAPQLTLTGSRSIVVTEGGTIATPCGVAALGADATCRFYKLTVTAAAASGQLHWDAPANRDLGVYVLNSTGTSCLSWFADDNGRQSGAVGEASSSFSCTSGAAANLAAGNVIIAVVNFHGSEGPVTWFQFRMSQP